MTQNPPAADGPQIDQGTRLALWCLIPMTPLAPICAALVGNAYVMLGLISLCAGIVALIAVSQFPKLTKPVLAGVLLLQNMTFTASLNGHPWQIDTHMVYFAVLAVVAIMNDVKVLLGAAGFIAVHHIGMSLTMPKMLYPDMTEGFLLRTVFHASVVVAETAFLALSIIGRQATDAEIARQRDTLEQTSAANKQAEETAQAERRAAAEAMAVLDSHLQQLADQDLSQTIEGELPAEYDQIRQTFNHLVVSLRAVLETATDTSADFRTSSRELSGAADDLAQRTETQSGTLSQTADSLQGLTSKLRETADGAKQAEDTAARARDSAIKNGDTVRDAVEAMRKIEESSGEISNIISMIEDISFQTNLLALNAGVEAARAGESGRGFAVVASEVRALAQRTSEAAQSVKQLIFRSSQQVEMGSNLVNAAGEALTGIVAQVSETNAMIGDISGSVGNQAAIVGELNDAIQSLDKATQHNAAMCQQMTAMGHQLSQGSDALSGALSGFRFAQNEEWRRAS